MFKNIKNARAKSILAIVTAFALLVTGIFAPIAWTAISQQAQNLVRGTIDVPPPQNPGGRLHDMFDGNRKEVFVENYGDTPIFARVQLSEFMQVGPAGVGNAVAPTTGFGGAQFNNIGSWIIHRPNATPAAPHTNVNPTNETDVARQFRTYWDWTMGGQTIFMPTFNQDNQCLQSDIRGNNGWTSTGGVTIDNQDNRVQQTPHLVPDLAPAPAPSTLGITDWRTWTVGQAEGPRVLYYRDENGNQQTRSATHNAQHTAAPTPAGPQGGGVILMTDWNAMSRAQQDVFIGWVMDADGWAYWSQPIQPGTATSMLLNGISMRTSPGQDWFYAINARGQFTTANGNWPAEFGVNGQISPDGTALMNQITGGGNTGPAFQFGPAGASNFNLTVGETTFVPFQLIRNGQNVSLGALDIDLALTGAFDVVILPTAGGVNLTPTADAWPLNQTINAQGRLLEAARLPGDGAGPFTFPLTFTIAPASGGPDMNLFQPVGGVGTPANPITVVDPVDWVGTSAPVAMTVPAGLNAADIVWSWGTPGPVANDNVTLSATTGANISINFGFPGGDLAFARPARNVILQATLNGVTRNVHVALPSWSMF